MAHGSDPAPAAGASQKGRFSRKVQTLQWLDRRLGVPVCFALTIGRRLSDWFRGNPVETGPVRRILFLKLAEQGSTVLAHDAVRRAVERAGRNNVYFLVFEENRFVVELLGLIPEANILAVRTHSAWAMIASFVANLRSIRRLGIDACVDMEFFARGSAALSFLSGARRRVGFHSYFGEGPYRGDLLTHRVLYNPHLHASATFSSLVESLDADPTLLPALNFRAQPSAVPSLFHPSVQERAAVRTLLDGLGVAPHGRLILLNANAGDLLPLRRWAEENYAVLARRLLAEFADAWVAFTGAPEEAASIAALAESVGSTRSICVAGRTSLRELLTVYELAEVLVTNDSGPAHFAALTSIDTVTLFGPETPLLFGALGPRSHPLWAGIACSPCINALNNRQTACRNNLCMQAISVEEVFALVARLYVTRVRTPQKSTVTS